MCDGGYPKFSYINSVYVVWNVYMEGQDGLTPVFRGVFIRKLSSTYDGVVFSGCRFPRTCHRDPNTPVQWILRKFWHNAQISSMVIIRFICKVGFSHIKQSMSNDESECQYCYLVSLRPTCNIFFNHSSQPSGFDHLHHCHVSQLLTSSIWKENFVSGSHHGGGGVMVILIMLILSLFHGNV